ncbi:hypothetical protein SNL152K_9968 [Streptomyces sp. NL15-2K]|nr:hypothetical protein SNL152K_9968 [Streptomyces sp. NL15-2K]
MKLGFVGADGRCCRWSAVSPQQDTKCAPLPVRRNAAPP